MTEENGNANASLRDRFRSLSTARAGSVDRWLLIAGAVIAPLGVLLIILGWVGAAGTPFVFEQIPYVISGGLLGLALVFVGGFVYFTYWQTRSVRESRQQQQELLAKLDQIAALLSNDAPVTSSERLVTTAKGAMYHRPECPVAQRGGKLRTVRGDERGLRPCGICNPVAVA